jgi:hypothetical protein
VLATAIRIHACFETDVRAVVAADDRLRPIAKILGSAAWSFRIVLTNLHDITVAKIDMEFFKSVSRAP